MPGGGDRDQETLVQVAEFGEGPGVEAAPPPYPGSKPGRLLVEGVPPGERPPPRPCRKCSRGPSCRPSCSRCSANSSAL